MKAVFNRQVLFEAILGVSRAVSQKKTLPSIEGILFTTEDNVVTMTGYNFEIVITTKIEADVSVQGGAVINAHLLSDFVKMADGANVSIEIDDGMNAVIKSGSGEIKFMAIPVSDFPEIPKPTTDSSLGIDGRQLKEMADMTLYAVSQDDQKPVHMGTKFIIENNTLSMVSVDGYRLAVCTRAVDNAEDKSFVVPGRSLSEISKLIAEDEATVYINTARRYALFYLAKYTVMTRLLEGDFLDYKRSIPTGWTTRVKVPIREFSASVERAALIITERLKNPIKFVFDPIKTTISCVTTLGSVYDEMVLPVEGETITIGFNNRYIIDALRNCNCDEVYFEMSDANRPLKIVPIEGDEFLHLVLPVRIKVE